MTETTIERLVCNPFGIGAGAWTDAATSFLGGKLRRQMQRWRSAGRIRQAKLILLAAGRVAACTQPANRLKEANAHILRVDRSTVRRTYDRLKERANG